jgi:hypothetical protein
MLLLSIVLVAGCGKATYPIEGVIVFADTGQPATGLTGYVVTLEALEKPVSATGEVKADGRFLVSTYNPDDGAIPGKHRVAITPPMGDSDRPRPKSILLPRYQDLKESGLEIDVAPGKREFTLTVERLKS